MCYYYFEVSWIYNWKIFSMLCYVRLCWKMFYVKRYIWISTSQTPCLNQNLWSEDKRCLKGLWSNKILDSEISSSPNCHRCKTPDTMLINLSVSTPTPIPRVGIQNKSPFSLNPSKISSTFKIKFINPQNFSRKLCLKSQYSDQQQSYSQPPKQGNVSSCFIFIFLT